MRELRDLNGNIVDKKNLPKLRAYAIFEGEVEFKHGKTHIEYAGLCQHCHSVVAGVLHIEDENLQMAVRPLSLMAKLEKQCAEIMKRRHQCTVVYDGKTNVDDWFKSMRQE